MFHRLRSFCNHVTKDTNTFHRIDKNPEGLLNTYTSYLILTQTLKTFSCKKIKLLNLILLPTQLVNSRAEMSPPCWQLAEAGIFGHSGE